MSAISGAFDGIAATYDRDWSESPAGRLQREAVWRELSPLFQAGHRVLDVGCGTGEDAEWLLRRGVHVTAVDPSPEMVRRARAKGIDASVGCLAAEVDRRKRLSHVGKALSPAIGLYDGVLSNFAALNCVPDPADLRQPLSTLVRAGGHLALCMFGKFCAWETCWYGLHFDLERATRRWGPKTRSKSLGVDVYYPSIEQVRAALAPDFLFLRAAGIGLFVPPSFVQGLPGAAVRMMGALDRSLAFLPGLRSLCDHQLLLFHRR